MRNLALIFSFFIVLNLSGSTTSDAENAYKKEDWTTAESLYGRLLKTSPTNRIYNHRYGVAAYHIGLDLVTAEKHLLKAKNQGITLSSYYLGRICFLQYRFEDAINHYKSYTAKATDKEQIALANEHLSKCKQGKELISRTEDIKILDKVILDRKNFFLNYNINKEVGLFYNNASIINELETDSSSSIYLTERGDRAFFAIQNEDNSDLYTKNKLLDQWAEKISLGKAVNSEKDEAFPFLMSDGIVLYFSSKGHNSFGGYDIYITRYNTPTNNYLPPQQLGMPFNSLGDDIMLAIDEYNNIGWFASDRDCKKGKIAIYTFVPNEYLKLLETSDEDTLIKAAKGEFSNTTISDSMLNREKIFVVKTDTQPKTQEIYFVINDTLIYSSLNDFMSEKARDIYINYEKKAARYDSVSLAVNEMRKAYSQISDSKEKTAMIGKIMTLENNSYDLEKERDIHLHSSRRVELETILANGGYKKEKYQKTEAAIVKVQNEEEHNRTPWENPIARNNENVNKPFFYNKTLLAYYDQIYSENAIIKLIEANQKKTDASNLMYKANDLMNASKASETDENVFEKLFAIDTSITPELTQADLLTKTSKMYDESERLIIEANYLNLYTLKEQNIILLNSIKDEKYRMDMNELIEKSNFSLQTADQNIYFTENVYSNNKTKLSNGNQKLIEGIQFLELASLTYIKYRYETQKVDSSNITTNNQIETKPEPINVQEEEQVIPKNSDKIDYRIQFGIFSKKLKESDINLEKLSFKVIDSKPLYKYFTGHYLNKEEAETNLANIKSKGFKDAYVVKFINGQIEDVLTK